MPEKSEKAEKSRCNPLILIIIFLVISLITVLSVVIILRLTDKKEAIHFSKPEKLIGKEKDFEKTTERPSDKEKDKEKEVISPSDKNSTGKVEDLEKVAKGVCNSPECIHLAYQLHNWRNISIDPCIDFYKASCGRFTEFSSSFGSRMREKADIFERLMRDFLKKNQSSTSKSENNLKKLYGKCEALKKKKIWDSELKKTMVEVLKNIGKIGAWPILDSNWDSKNFKLNDFLVNMVNLNMQDFGLFSWMHNKKFLIESTEYQKFLKAEELEFLTGTILKANSITNIDQTRLTVDMKDVVDFAKKIKSLHESRKGQILLPDVKKSAPSIDFDRILKAILNPRDSEFENLEKRVVSVDLRMFSDKKKNLENLLKATPPRTVANYLISIYILTIASQTEPKYNCEKTVTEILPQASLLVLVRRYFDQENIILAANMVEELKKSYAEIFQKSKFLSPGTKEELIKKVGKMTFLAAYPDNGWEEEVERLHGKLTISMKDTFLETMNKINGWKIHNSIDRILSDSKFDGDRDMMIVNAYYNPTINHLAITLPFIDDPHFDSTFPKYAQLATTGRVLAHEIGHGFDSRGILYNGDGDLRDLDDRDMEAYLNRTECLIDQYDEYDDPDYGKNLDGSKTIREMIADQLGAEAAWMTFKKLNLTEELEIFGFEGLDIDKMFFHIATLDHCMGPDTESLKRKLKRKHPTQSFRVNGVFSNMKQFAETFECKVGTPMNPVKKCEIF